VSERCEDVLQRLAIGMVVARAGGACPSPLTTVSNVGSTTSILSTGFGMGSVVGAYQAVGGDQCAVAAHCRGDGAGTGSHSGFEGVIECARQRVGGRYDGRVCASDSEVVDSLCEVVLIVVLGDDDLGCTGSRGRGCGAGAAVVVDGGDSFEQRLLVDLSDGQAVGFMVHQ